MDFGVGDRVVQSSSSCSAPTNHHCRWPDCRAVASVVAGWRCHTHFGTVLLSSKPQATTSVWRLRASVPGLVWHLIFVRDFCKRDCGMLFISRDLYFRTSLKTTCTEPWLVLAGKIQFVHLMGFPVPALGLRSKNFAVCSV